MTNADPHRTALRAARGSIALRHDLEELDTYARRLGPNRLRVDVARWMGLGDAPVREVTLWFGPLPTPVRWSGGVRVAELRLVARIRPAPGVLPYPLAAPLVRVDYDGLSAGEEPFVPSLLWDRPVGMPAFARVLIDAVDGWGGAPFRSQPVGVACLWRTWSPTGSLARIAQALSRMTVVHPATMASPGDAWNPEAARYFAAHPPPFRLPLGDPLPDPADVLGDDDGPASSPGPGRAGASPRRLARRTP